MKINITIKTKNNLDPLTTNRDQLEQEVARILAAEAKKLRDCTNTVYAREARMDKNGNTIGYDFTFVV